MRNAQSMRPKALLRRVVLRTSIPPLLQAYRGLYWLVVYLAVQIFKRHPGVTSVYVRRGCAKGDIVPGISDVDFQVVTDGTDQTHVQRLRRKYRRFARIALVADQEIAISDQQELQRQFEHSFSRFPLIEGRESWRLLYGVDVVKQLRPASAVEAQSATYYEMLVWWTRFSALCLQIPESAQEPALRNSLCYKTVCEVLRSILALNHGFVTFQRREALTRATPLLSDRDQALVRRLKGIAAARFLPRDELVLNLTYEFLLRQIDSCHAVQASQPEIGLQPEIKQSADGPTDEWWWSLDQQAHLAGLIAHVEGNQGRNYGGVHLVPGFRSLDQFECFVEINFDNPPEVSQVAELVRLHRTLGRDESRTNLYFLLRHCAVQIDATYGRQSWLSVLSPYRHPDVFAFLETGEAGRTKRHYQPYLPAAWSDAARQVHGDIRCGLLRHLCPRRPTLRGLNQANRFWKLMQLALVERSIQQGVAAYPLTLGAILRAVRRTASLSRPIEPIAEMYRRRLLGEIRDDELVVRDAHCYLRELEGET